MIKLIVFMFLCCAANHINSGSILIYSKVDSIENTVTYSPEDIPAYDVPLQQTTISTTVPTFTSTTQKIEDQIPNPLDTQNEKELSTSSADVTNSTNKNKLKGDNINEGVSGILLGVGSVAVGALVIDMGINNLNSNATKSLGIVGMTGSTVVVVGGAVLVTFGIFLGIWGIGRLFCWW